ncbi:endo-1,4-beta-xylanase [Sphingobacterium thalpophilum]|uniref:endo-1,4-beta-xylanase n=2 Tax=Sphingobacterium thalpophilum TaxID=259 RepID=UPI0024A6E36E|nr:endo-1,4-beta-xylanase [Sphingobacterium thalpophilum]
MNIVKTIGVALMALWGIPPVPAVRQQAKPTADSVRLKDAFEHKFFIGTALNLEQIWERNSKAVAVVKRQFNSIVAENCMKSMFLQPREGEFFFRDADRFVAFGEKYKMQMIGHTLIWHSQAPQWFFVDKNGKEVSRETLIDRMRKHIQTIVTRYRGRIFGWDVVNEAILDNGDWRKSKFYDIIGPEFIELAFKFAHEADPEAELYYNDYSTAIPAKRKAIMALVQRVKATGVPVHAVGMQEHNGLYSPALEEVEKTILGFASLGVQVMVTEMDISVLPHVRPEMGAEVGERHAYSKKMNPYDKGLPASKMAELGRRYTDFFKLYLKHQDKISRVTLWGVADGDSWKNDWPIVGRKDYPLLFDRDYQPKSFVRDIIRVAQQAQKMEKVGKSRYLYPDDYMADPSAHVFEHKIYIYPSHDRESGIPENDSGDHFDMQDYHVFSMEDIGGKVVNHGKVLEIKDIPWAGRQLWDSDVTQKDGKYYMYFSLKDKNDIFRIGVAVGERPYGPFVPQANPIKGSYSIDPCAFRDEDGSYYLYFGGIWGGQLQFYRNNKITVPIELPLAEAPALTPKVAKIAGDMLEFSEQPRDLVILDKSGKPLKQGDTERRFFEASWMHKYKGKYYFSYSTGDSHLICYAIGDNPYGPFTYEGILLSPVVGWTTHHSIMPFKGKWYLFYHDSAPSGGKTWLRSMKVVELEYDKDGRIKPINGLTS